MGVILFYQIVLNLANKIKSHVMGFYFVIIFFIFYLIFI